MIVGCNALSEMTVVELDGLVMGMGAVIRKAVAVHNLKVLPKHLINLLMININPIFEYLL